MAQQRSMTSCAKSRSDVLCPLPTDEAAPPPKPINIDGPPRTISGAPTTTSFFSTWGLRTLPRPPAIMMGLW